jgi:hypothetical protein
MAISGARKANNNDLRVFCAYFEDLCRTKKISNYRALKDANLNLNYYNSIKQYLKGSQQFRKAINISLIIHIAQVHKFPFDLSKYLHVLEEENKPII